jgi:hypothetical protein
MKVFAKLRTGIAGAAPLTIAVGGIVVGLTTGAAIMGWTDAASQASTSGPSVAQAQAAATNGPCNGKPAKYYRNPMGAPDTSPVPKKDSMNMDYIPVCEDEAGAVPGTVKISLDKVQLLGVRSEEVQARALVTHRARLRQRAVRRTPPVRWWRPSSAAGSRSSRQRHRRRRDARPDHCSRSTARN